MTAYYNDVDLVRPAGPGTKPTEAPKATIEADKREPELGGGGGGEPPAIDPIIAGLLKRLPKTGDVWPDTERKLWLQLLEGSFKLIYKDRAELPNAEPRRKLTPEEQHALEDGDNQDWTVR